MLSTVAGLQVEEVARVKAAGEERHQKTGTEGMQHAERREQGVRTRFLTDVANRVRDDAAGVLAVVAIGTADMRRALIELLNPGLPAGELDWNPDPQKSPTALAISGVAQEAVADQQTRDISDVTENAGIDDWRGIALALRDGRLHDVWLDAGAALHSYICNGCENVVEGAGACAACGASPWERLPLPEYVLRHGRRTGAEVHFVSGRAAEALAAGTGSLGGRATDGRFRPPRRMPRAAPPVHAACAPGSVRDARYRREPRARLEGEHLCGDLRRKDIALAPADDERRAFDRDPHGPEIGPGLQPGRQHLAEVPRDRGVEALLAPGDR